MLCNVKPGRLAGLFCARDLRGAFDDSVVIVPVGAGVGVENL
mgnify:CR=1 FL=1